METRLNIDWISTTSHKDVIKKEYSTHPVLHDWENWEETNGRNGYTKGAKHASGTKVYKNDERPDMGIHTIYSGKTLQRINKMYNINSLEVLKHHISDGNNIARLDIALDFYGDGLSVSDFQDSFLRGQAVTRLRNASVIKSLTDRGHTLYLGSKKRRKKLVRIYDKSAESGWEFACTRVEVQLMGKPATTVAIEAVRGKSTTEVLLGAIKDVIDFPMITEWNVAMQSASTIEIGTEYDQLGDTKKWLDKTVRACLIKEAILDLNWWVQYKLDIDFQVAFTTNMLGD